MSFSQGRLKLFHAFFQKLAPKRPNEPWPRGGLSYYLPHGSGQNAPLQVSFEALTPSAVGDSIANRILFPSFPSRCFFF